jgi:hypothetical protein
LQVRKLLATTRRSIIMKFIIVLTVDQKGGLIISLNKVNQHSNKL